MAQTKAQHTPGPWKHNGLKEPYFTDGRDSSEWLACAVWAKRPGDAIEDIPICTTAFSVGKYNEVDPETQHANAVLIAAAPDLLEALKGLQKAIRDAGLLNIKKHFDICVHDAAAITAIAKAEGRY